MCGLSRYYGYRSCLWLALVLLAGTSGSGMAQKDKNDKKEDKPIAVSAVDLTKAYQSTSDGNKAYYLKTVIVEGKVVEKDKIAVPVVFLEGDKGPKGKAARRVMCNMKPDFKASDLKVGDTVKIQGVCKGTSIDPGVVELWKCELVK